MSPSESKQKTVEDFVRLFNEYPIIAIVNMENLPAKQLQAMRSSLRDTVIIRMCKRRLLKLAIEKTSKKNIKNIENYLKGMPAIIFTKENPFKLYSRLEKSKSTAPIKPGQKAPKDIIVPAGQTSFAPGPIIGELGQAKIKAGIEGGKVVIKQDSVVAREGEIVSAAAASVLARLGIEPMEIGLNVVAVYEDGDIYTKDILSIDESKYLADIQMAARVSFNISLEIGYVSKDNIQFLISKAFNNSKNLAIAQDLITDLTAGNLAAKAEAQMKSLAKQLNLPPKQETKEEKKEEKHEKPKKEKAEKKEEEKLEEIKEESVELKKQVTDEDIRQAEENLKRIQNEIIHGKRG